MIRMLRNVEKLCLNFLILFFDLNHWNMGDFDVILVHKIANGCNLKKNMISFSVKKNILCLLIYLWIGLALADVHRWLKSVENIIDLIYET